ncbi:MAG: YaaL family protein [Clostridia bacterium]|nr:YaaL family protein [Clostridia bacterium]
MTLASVTKAGTKMMEWIQQVSEKNRLAVEEQEKTAELFSSIEQARRELCAAQANYDYAKDPSLLEYCIYDLKAAEMRLNYFLKLAKKEGLSHPVYMTGTLTDRGRGEKVL